MSVFYCPNDGFVGDMVPFYWKGQYHAFYLKAPVPPRRRGSDHTSYGHVVSSDLARWEEWPTVIEPGALGEPDSVATSTGSVIERNGIFHLFYFARQESKLEVAETQRLLSKPETICHAVSKDLRSWEKDSRNPILLPDSRWYEPFDFRDPFPFWNEQSREYWMLLASRGKEGPSNRRGCLALAVSPDLKRWEVRPPLWSPGLYFTHECPDLFRWEDHWVLVFSEFNYGKVTRYRNGQSLQGSWIAPSLDTFDTTAFYAAKTASNGARRFIFGWNPTREGETDSGKWQWAGNLVVHELKPGKNGNISVKVVPEVEALFNRPELLSFRARLGHWEKAGTSFKARCADSFAACTLGTMPATCRITLVVSSNSGTQACGILLRVQPGMEGYYQLRWEPWRRRVVFDRWPRPGNEAFMLERPMDTARNQPLKLNVLVDDSVIVAYLDDSVALSCRGYDHRTGQLGLFADGGEVSFSEVKMYGI